MQAFVHPRGANHILLVNASPHLLRFVTDAEWDIGPIQHDTEYEGLTMTRRTYDELLRRMKGVDSLADLVVGGGTRKRPRAPEEEAAAAAPPPLLSRNVHTQTEATHTGEAGTQTPTAVDADAAPIQHHPHHTVVGPPTPTMPPPPPLPVAEPAPPPIDDDASTVLDLHGRPPSPSMASEPAAPHHHAGDGERPPTHHRESRLLIDQHDAIDTASLRIAAGVPPDAQSARSNGCGSHLSGVSNMQCVLQRRAWLQSRVCRMDG